MEFVGLKVRAIVCVEKKLPLTVFVYEALPTGVTEPATDKVCDTDVVKDPDEVASCVVVRVPVAATVTVTLAPTLTVCDAGWVVMVGAVPVVPCAANCEISEMLSARL